MTRSSTKSLYQWARLLHTTDMAGNEYNATRPKEPQDRARIAAGSPLAVLGIFLESLRERFLPDNGMDIHWTEDVQTTDITIEVGYSVESEIRNATRALYVNRLNTSPANIAVGDRVGVRLPDHLEGFMCHMGSQITIDCVSNDAGDCALLADVVQHWLIANRQIYASLYGFHDVSLAEMGQTQPFKHDQQKWSTTVSVAVVYPVRWSTVKIRPLLQDVGVSLAGVTEALEAVAVTSMQRSCSSVEQPAYSALAVAGACACPEPPPIDPPPGVPGLRTLGTGPNQALPGNTAIPTQAQILAWSLGA